ncbi:MAG: DUF4173 domain-containing protein [Actinomycetales bacterium]|nr:DUF4173 domain-containing protein [Actinomycetales bacterium]
MSAASPPPPPPPAPAPGAWSPPRRPAPAAWGPRPPGPWQVAATQVWRDGSRPLPRAALAGGAVAGVVGGALLVGHRPGLGAALVALAAWIPAAGVLVRRRAWGDLTTATLAVALLATVALRDATWVVGIAATTGVAAMLVAVTGARHTRAVLLAPVAAVLGGLRLLPGTTRLARRAVGLRREVVLRVLRSAALTLVVVVVFGALFASADAVFAAYLPRPDLGRLPANLVVGAMVGLAALAAAHLAVAPPAWPGPTAAARARLADWLAPVVALDLVVAAFLAVQVGGLLDGHAHVLATTGLTYAQYARAGFGQLVVATALTLVVVAVAARRAPRQTPAERRLTGAALGVLCVGTLGVVASALRRMTLYVDAFGLTRLRLLVLVAEVVLGVLLVLVLVAGVRWRAGWLPRAAVHAVVVGVVALVLANPDALIVRFDAAAQAPLDVDYLSGLSADAVPAAATVDEPLRSCLLQLAASDPPADDGWVSWNAGRAAAARVLATDVPSAGADACDFVLSGG